MALQYSGNIYDGTFNATSRTDFVDDVKDALTAATPGWTSVSGASGDWILETVETAEGLKVRSRIWDPGSGNCARIGLKNVAGTIVLESTPTYCYPQSDDWYITCNGQQVFLYTASAASVARKWHMLAVPYLESFLSSVTDCAVRECSATSDTDATHRSGFMQRPVTGSGNRAFILNGNGQEYGNVAPYSKGDISLMSICNGLSNYPTNGQQWQDDSYLIWEPLLCFGWPVNTNYGKIVGQLTDAFLCSAPFDILTEVTFDAHDWRCVTHQWSGSTTAALGTLFLAIS